MYKQVPRHTGHLMYCKVRMQWHKLFLFVVKILHHWLRLHQFPSPALFFPNYLIPLLSCVRLFLLKSWSPFSSFVYLSCFWISLSFYHDCGLRLCDSFLCFYCHVCVNIFVADSLIWDWRANLSNCESKMKISSWCPDVINPQRACARGL